MLSYTGRQIEEEETLMKKMLNGLAALALTMIFAMPAAANDFEPQIKEFYNKDKASSPRKPSFSEM